MGYKRNNYFPKRSFQMRFLIQVFGGLSAIVLLLSLSFYGINFLSISKANDQLRQSVDVSEGISTESSGSVLSMLNNPALERNKQLRKDFQDILTRIERNMLFAFLGSLVVALVLCGTFFLILSHRIAGPIYRFEKTIHSIEQGDLTAKAFLRDKDELRDLADHLNQMTSSLNQKIHLIQQSIIQLQLDIEREGVSGETRQRLLERVGTLEALLKQFKIAYS